MELLFVGLIGFVLGLVALAPRAHREVIGAWLLPAVGAAVGCGVWVSLTWAGVPWDGGWIWVAALLAAAVAVVATRVVLTRRRVGADDVLSRELMSGRRPVGG